MDFREAKLRRVLAVAFAATVVWQSALAQTPIIFSKPADNPTKKANASVPSSHNDSSAFNAPSSLFNRPSADFSAPLPRATPLTASQIQQWQRTMEKQQDWALLTPREILGVPTVKQILGVPDKNDDQNLTLDQQYLQRLEQQRSSSATNAVGGPDESWRTDSNPFQTKQNGRQDDATGVTQRSAFNRFSNATANLQSVANQMANSQFNADQLQKRNAIWISAFTAPPAPVRPNPQQVAAMERFRSLLNGDSQQSEQGSATPSLYSPTATKTAPDPYLQPQPQFNPVGNSFTPLQTFQSSASLPTGIEPLPGIVARPKSLTENKPKPLVQLPPWLSNKSKPGTPLQRKF